jgi:ATP-dependent Clp protease ATP-binding subunit ClpC
MATHTMEQFTQRARRVLSFAQEEAERMQHSYIGTEHMLIGLMREEGGVAGRVLHDLGVNQRRVEELVERMTHAERKLQAERLVLSDDIKKVLELAVDEARRMGHHYLGTEHLLLGLVRQGHPTPNVAVDVLTSLNVNAEDVRRQTRRILQESPVQPLAPQSTAKPPATSLDELNERTLQPAIQEASKRGHRFAGTWHLLLVMLQHEGIAQRILRETGLDDQNLETMLGEPIKPSYTVPSKFGYGVNNDLVHAHRLASSMNDNVVREEHLLLALADHHEDMFELLHIDPERLHTELEKYFNAKQ